MRLPLQIAFDGIAQSDELEAFVRSESASLAEFAPLISIVRVVLGHPQRRYHTVNACRVHIQIGRPGATDIVITRDRPSPAPTLKTLQRQSAMPSRRYAAASPRSASNDRRCQFA